MPLANDIHINLTPANMRHILSALSHYASGLTDYVQHNRDNPGASNAEEEADEVISLLHTLTEAFARHLPQPRG